MTLREVNMLVLKCMRQLMGHCRLLDLGGTVIFNESNSILRLCIYSCSPVGDHRITEHTAREARRPE